MIDRLTIDEHDDDDGHDDNCRDNDGYVDGGRDDDEHDDDDGHDDNCVFVFLFHIHLYLLYPNLY